MSTYSITWVVLWICGYHCVMGQSMSSSEIFISQSHESLSPIASTIMVEPSYVSSQNLYTSFTPTFVTDTQSSKENVESNYVSSDVPNSIQSSYGLTSFSKDHGVTSSPFFVSKTTFKQESEFPSTSSSFSESAFYTTSFLVVASDFMTMEDSDGIGGSTLVQSEEMLSRTASFYTETNGDKEKTSSSQQDNVVTSNVISETDSLLDSNVTNENAIKSKYNTISSSVLSSLVQSMTVNGTDSSIEPSPTNINEASKMTSTVVYSTPANLHSIVPSFYSSDLQLNLTLSVLNTISTTHGIEGASSQATPVEKDEHSINVSTSSKSTLSFYSDIPQGSLDQSVISSDYSQQSDTPTYMTSAETASHMTEQLYEPTSSYTKHSPGAPTSLSDSVFKTNSVFLASSLFLSGIKTSYVSTSSISESISVSESTDYTGIEIASVQNTESTSAMFSAGLGIHSIGPISSSSYLQTEPESSSIEYSGSSNSYVFTTLDSSTNSLYELDTFIPKINQTDTFMSSSAQQYTTVASDSLFTSVNFSSTYIPSSSLVPLSTSHFSTIRIETPSMTGFPSNFDITRVSSKYNETSLDTIYQSVTVSQSQDLFSSESKHLPSFTVLSSIIESDKHDTSSLFSSQSFSTLETFHSGPSQITVSTSFEVSKTDTAILTSDISDQIKTTIQSSYNLSTLAILPTIAKVESLSSMDNSLFESIELTSSPMSTFSALDTTNISISESNTKSFMTSYSAIFNPSDTSIFKSQDLSNTYVLSSNLLETNVYFSTTSSNSDVQLDSYSMFDSVSSEIFTGALSFLPTTLLSEETHSEFETENSIIDTASFTLSDRGSDISSNNVSIGITSDTLSTIKLQSTESPEQPFISSPADSILSLSSTLSFPLPLTTSELDVVSFSTVPFKSSAPTYFSSFVAVDRTHVSPSPTLNSSYVENISQIFSSQMEGNSDISSFTYVLESSTFPNTLSSTPESFDTTSKMSSFVSELSYEYSTFSRLTDTILPKSTDASVMSTADASEVILESVQTNSSSFSIGSSSSILTTQIFTSNIIFTVDRPPETSDNTYTLSEEPKSLSTDNQISISITSISQTVDVSSIQPIDISTSIPITAANSSDFLLPSLSTISSLTSMSATIQLVTETVDSTVIFTSSTTPTSTDTTPRTPELTTNNITNADESYWIKTVLAVRKTIDIASESFRIDIEERMTEAYSEAFERERLMQQGLFENLRRKRYTSNGETSVHIHDVSRVGDSTSVNVVYAVEKSGTRLSPSDAVTSLNVLSTQELAIILRQVVQTVAEPYQSASRPDDITDDDGIPLWLVAAITGSVGGFIILVWLFVCVYIKCCREKKEMEKHVEPELTSIQQNDTRRETPKQQTDANGLGTSSRKSLPHQTSKSSLTKKSTAYQIKPSDEEALIETTAEPDVEEHVFENKLVTQASSPPSKHHSPRARSTENPIGSGSTTSLSHKNDNEPPRNTKKSKRASRLNGIDGSIPGMDYPDNIDKPRLLKYQFLQSSFSDQDNDDLRERTLLERQKNKERTKHKRRKPRHKDEVHPTSVLYSTMGIPSTPLPSVQVQSGSPVRENTRRSISNTIDGGMSTENLSGDESLQEARSRMHKLLDDAFSLISPRASFTENNFQRAIDSQPYINKEDGLTVRTRSVEKIDRETDEDVKHEPMYVNPFYSESSFPLETWSPYRTSDLVAMISMPSKQEPTKLGQKPKSATRPMSSKPNRRPAASFDFSETKSATTFDEDRFTTSPAKPIVIRTKPVTENGSAGSNKPSSNRIPSGRTTVMVSPLPKSNQNEQFEMNSLSKGSSRNGSAGKYKSRTMDRSNIDEIDVINDLDAEQSSDKLIKSLRDELGELKELYSVPNTRIERKKNKRNAQSSNTEVV